MVVSTPSSRMPDSNHSPLTPAPVPTSTTAFAPVSLEHTQQRTHRGGDGTRADVDGALAGGRDDGVFGDRLLGMRDDGLGAAPRSDDVVDAGHARSVERSGCARYPDTPVAGMPKSSE